jgi:hypothetical protein
MQIIVSSICLVRIIFHFGPSTFNVPLLIFYFDYCSLESVMWIVPRFSECNHMAQCFI